MKAEVVRAIVVGSVLIVLGFVPGLFQRLEEGIQEFSESLRSPFTRFALTRKTDKEKLARPTWLALLGVAMILVGLLLHVSD